MSLKNKFAFAAQTDTGRVRDHNEDAIESNLDIGMLVLADGMPLIWASRYLKTPLRDQVK